jgi:hypothetical protein
MICSSQMPLKVTAGVDTWSLCWRLDDGTDVARAADEQAVMPTRRGRMLEELVDGYRVVLFPSAGLLAAEGHPAGEGHLAPAATLLEAQERLTRALEAQLGAELPVRRALDFEREGEFTSSARRSSRSSHAVALDQEGIAGVRRLDIALDLAWDGDRREGLAFLAGAAAVNPPGQLQARFIRQPGGSAYETIAWHGKRGLMGRLYDKGNEALTAPRGQLVRMEDQRRWPSGHRRDVEELTAENVQRIWQKRFLPLWRATKGLKIVTTAKLARELKSAVNEDRCTPGQAIDVAGHLVMEAAGVHVGSRNTRWRHASKARELGLVLVDGVLEEEEYDVGEMMEAAFDPAVWSGPGPQG